MLGFAFFTSIFSTFSWLIFCFIYISDKLTGVSAASLGVADISVYTVMTTLPILIIWLIFGYVISFLNSRMNAKNFLHLFAQNKKSQDYSDLIARALIECEQNIRSGFILNKFDIFIVDLNELISEIISRCKVIAEADIQDAWARTENGGKWFLGKLIIEAHRKRSDFSAEIIRKSESDPIIEGTILEFCARYQSLVVILEKNDKERLLLEIVETGVMGKVFSIMAPIADKIRKTREHSRGFFGFTKEKKPDDFMSDYNNLNSSEPVVKKKGLFSKVFKKPEPEISEERNEPSVEHSFEKDFDFESNIQENEEKTRPSFFDLPREDEADAEFENQFFSKEPVEDFEEDVLEEDEEEISKTPTITEMAMENLKKDWENFENLEKIAPTNERRKEPTLGNLSSSDEPFGKWENEENYKK
ncbi:MAG: hypothetical protein ACK5N8_00810 [Alphaproteobacteria bacterium]